MNARQKAKSYKKKLKAYENLYCKTNSIYIDRTQLIHRKIAFSIYIEDLINDPDTAMNEACSKICHDIIPIACDNITETFDPLHKVQKCVFDMWTLK